MADEAAARVGVWNGEDAEEQPESRLGGGRELRPGLAAGGDEALQPEIVRVDDDEDDGYERHGEEDEGSLRYTEAGELLHGRLMVRIHVVMPPLKL